MTAYQTQMPVYKVRCDHEGCDTVFEPDSDWDKSSSCRVRWAAGDAGWDVPPVSGKGSRSKDTYCPKHPTRVPTP